MVFYKNLVGSQLFTIWRQFYIILKGLRKKNFQILTGVGDVRLATFEQGRQYVIILQFVRNL